MYERTHSLELLRDVSPLLVLCIKQGSDVICFLATKQVLSELSYLGFLLSVFWGYWLQRADEKVGDPLPPKVDPGAFGGTFTGTSLIAFSRFMVFIARQHVCACRV